MGWRFQKRVKLLPGVTLNLSKSGVSTSIGGRGGRVTVGRGKVRRTVGLPGTGLSFSDERRIGKPAPPPAEISDGDGWRLIGWSLVVFLVLAWLFS